MLSDLCLTRQWKVCSVKSAPLSLCFNGHTVVTAAPLILHPPFTSSFQHWIHVDLVFLFFTLIIRKEPFNIKLSLTIHICSYVEIKCTCNWKVQLLVRQCCGEKADWKAQVRGWLQVHVQVTERPVQLTQALKMERVWYSCNDKWSWEKLIDTWTARLAAAAPTTVHMYILRKTLHP